MEHNDLHPPRRPSRRATVIFVMLLALVCMATVGSMVASVILYMKSV